eukprot:CAMPEP_0182528266 /NCGR_PEP_ID=MMETSP1323-20130603/4399_1 /TAXON_ID=236787 /ORGANISM="Florenciella parvula, Strain RCC1693" /LENGTH=390 /DNA_ID=CAMNT_0024737367 /DNA_START=76 /DNA_END=1245 /DNA_ORIENTATION=+
MASMASPSADAPSEYELLRAQNIARNAAKLVGLGLEDATMKKKASPKKKAPKKKASAPVEGERRSKRNRGEAPQYTKEKIDNFGEELDRMAGGCSAKRAFGLANGLANPTQSEQAEEMSEEHKAMMLEVRNDLLAKRASHVAKVETDDEVAWKAEAVGRWGDMVELATPESWQVYVRSRLCTPPPPCPDGVSLLQERYTEDAWHLLVACNLMSRVSSGPVKERCINGFFSRWPTPTAALNANPNEVLPVLESLGLFEGRYRSICDVSHNFLSLPEFECERKGDFKFHGIGEFGVTSFEIWARGLGLTLHPEDRNLASYCDALRRVAKKGGDAGGDAGGGVGGGGSVWQTPAADLSKRAAGAGGVTVKPEPMEESDEEEEEEEEALQAALE